MNVMLWEAFMSKISIRIALAIIGSCILLSIAFTAMSAYKSTGYFELEAQEKLLNLSEKYAHRFGISLGKVENTVDVMYSTFTSTFDSARLKQDPVTYLNEYMTFIDPLLKSAASENRQVQGIYFTLNPELIDQWHEIWYSDPLGDGNYVLTPMDPDTLKNVSPDNPEFDYYYAPVLKGAPIWIDPYTDNTIGVYMISYVRPIIIDGQVIGVIGADLKIEDIAKTIREMQVYDTGFSMLINTRQDVIIHPELNTVEPLKTLMNGAYHTLSKSIEEQRSGFLTLDYLGQEHMVAYFTLQNDWVFAVQTPSREALKNSNSLTESLVIIGILGSLLASVVGVFLARSLDKTINTQARSVQEANHRLMEAEKIASLGYLVSGVAHEINTPVGNCITLTSYIQREVAESLPVTDDTCDEDSEIKAALVEIDGASRHILKNLNDAQQILSAFKELAVTRTTGVPETILVHSQIQTIFDSLARRSDAKHIGLELACDKGLTLTGNEQQFDQIFYHLMNNSLIHGFDTEGEGTIWIKVIGVPNGIQISYRDNGKGIKGEILKNLYVPFFSTRFGAGHKGLGMITVYNIVRGPFRGSIHMESPETGGVEVHIELFNREGAD